MIPEGGRDRPGIIHELDNLIQKYDTGWINRSDWTNVHMGSNTTKNADSNVTHNLDTDLSRLIVKVLISTDGTDVNSFEINTVVIDWASAGDRPIGITVFYIDANNIILQTGANGIGYINNSGNAIIIDTEDWYYKIKVYRINI